MAVTRQRSPGGEDEAGALIRKAGFRRATPLQQRVVPLLLAHRDIAVEAAGGSGKTTAAIIPLIVRGKPAAQGTAALVLLPSAEALRKAQRQWKTLAKAASSTLTHAVIGVDAGIRKEATLLGQRPNVLFASPERLIDHIRQGNVSLAEVRYVAVDAPPEPAGFLRDVEFVLAKCSSERQTAFFVASLDEDTVAHIGGSRQRVTLRHEDWDVTEPEPLPEATPQTPGGRKRRTAGDSGDRRPDVSSDPGGGAKIDEETLTSTIRTYLERITRVEDPRDMKGLKRIYRRNVPLHLRGYFAAYLLRELAGSAPAPAGRLARLFINAGRNRRVFPKDLYDLFTSQLKIPRSEIGEVRVLDNYSFVEIQPRHADRAIAELTGKEFRGRKLSVNYARPREDKKRE